jgi:Beta-galactosidase
VAAEPRRTYGTLVSLPEHSVDEARAGIRAAMVELAWDQFEPAPGRFDAAYIQGVRDTIDRLRATGRTITLGLGMHYTPAWLSGPPYSHMADELGNVSAEPNLIFDERVRQRAEGYLDKVATAIDLSEVAAVRVTSGSSAEVLYPPGGGYWAFDDNAQNGRFLPPSMAPNPAPGWRPGQPGLTDDQVRQWSGWYVGGLADAVEWQIETLTRLGFRGSYQVLTPGVGLSPAEYDEAVADGLPRGLLGVGAAWQVLYDHLPPRPDLVVYSTSVADGSGGDDDCHPGDRAVPLRAPEVEAWSATRWLRRLADEHGLTLAGENPGWHQSEALDARYVDHTDDGMMARALRQAHTCNLTAFYWAHDTQLWDGTASFAQYSRLAANPPG